MTEETEEQTEGLEGVTLEPEQFSTLMRAAIGEGFNPKPDTAQGIAEIVNTVHDLLGDNQTVRFGVATAPDGSEIPVVIRPDGGYNFLGDADFGRHMQKPMFRRGIASMTSLDSLIAHINRFGDVDSAVFACDRREAPSLTAVLDYHRADNDGVHGDYRHGLHRSTFNFPLSDEWKMWNDANGTQMTMGDFAAFLEKSMGDFALIEDDVPESAERFVEVNGGKKLIADYGKLYDLARGLRINENSVVEEAVNLASGEGKIRLSNEHEAKMGDTTISVPTMFFIAIPVFRNGQFYRLPARLRYRKTSSGLSFWFDLHRPDRAFDNAFHEAVTSVAGQTEAQIFYGYPE